GGGAAGGSAPRGASQSDAIASRWPARALSSTGGRHAFARRQGRRIDQNVEQRLRLLQVLRREAFAEPAVDRRKEFVCLPDPPLVARQPGIARRGAQLP